MDDFWLFVLVVVVGRFNWAKRSCVPHDRRFTYGSHIIWTICKTINLKFLNISQHIQRYILSNVQSKKKKKKILDHNEKKPETESFHIHSCLGHWFEIWNSTKKKTQDKNHSWMPKRMMRIKICSQKSSEIERQTKYKHLLFQPNRKFDPRNSIFFFNAQRNQILVSFLMETIFFWFKNQTKKKLWFILFLVPIKSTFLKTETTKPDQTTTTTKKICST